MRTLLNKELAMTQTATNTPVDALWELYERRDFDELLRQIGPIGDLLADDGMPTEHTAPQLELLGLILHERGQVSEATDTIEKAGLVVSLRDKSLIALASGYAERGKIDNAREMYLQLALSNRLPSEMMLEVAARLEAIDAPYLAMQVCEWITERDAEFAQAYYDMGCYSARVGNALHLTEALTQHALQLEPDNVNYRVGLASLMIQLDRDEEAVEALRSVTNEQIAVVKCRSCLGRIAALMRRHDHAERADACDDRIAALESRAVKTVAA